MSQRIGLIGPGAMGLAMTQCLIRGGFQVYTRDIDPERDALARAAGAVVCASPAQVAREAGIVITVVINQEQTEAVCFADDGLCQTLEPGGVVMLCSTVGPSYASALAARLAERGFAMLDAPISGGPARAAAGTMSMMLAGSEATRARCEPVLRTLSDKRFVVSDQPGDGSCMKLVNNLMAAINLVGAAEAFALGIRSGLDPRKIHEVMAGSSGQSFMGVDRMQRVIDHDLTVTAASPILTKDVSLAMNLAQQLHFPATLGSVAHQALQATVGMGLHDQDDAWVIRVYQALSGIDLPG